VLLWHRPAAQNKLQDGGAIFSGKATVAVPEALNVMGNFMHKY